MLKRKKHQLVRQVVQLGVGFSLGLGAPVLLMSSAMATTAENSLTQTPQGAVLETILATEKRVDDLLSLAVQHVQEKGITGVNDFNRDPRFTDNELYVFSLSRTGVILSSGGWSTTLIGQNVLSMTDEDERPFFQKMLDQAKVADAGSVEYLWFNPADGNTDPKITHFRVVDNVVIAAGYFPGFSTETQAKELLDLAVSEYFKNPVLALRKFRNRQSGFRNRDQYVFVLDKSERTVLWTPSSPELNDKSLDDVVDIQGSAFLAQMVDTASPNRIQQIDYWWFSPITKRVELRRAFYQQVGDSVLGVGTFILPN